MKVKVVPHVLWVTITLLVLTIIVPFGGTEAYLVTSPGQNEFWYFGNKKTLRWSSVSTDPGRFSIAISNQDPSTYPSALSRLIVKGVPKKLGKFRIPASTIKGLKEGSGYQINIMSLEGGAILAQSPLFTISYKDETDWEYVDDSQLDDPDSVPTTTDQTTGVNPNHHGENKVKGEENKQKDTVSTPWKNSRLGKANHSKNKGHHASQRKFQRAKSKSDSLLKSIPKFDHSRGACPRSPNNPRVGKIIRA